MLFGQGRQTVTIRTRDRFGLIEAAGMRPCQIKTFRQEQHFTPLALCIFCHLSCTLQVSIRLATLAGDQWSEPITIAEGPDLVANWADFPRSAMGGDDARYVHGLHRSGESPYAYEIQLYRLDDGTVESLGVMHRDGTPTEHGFVSMVPTTDGVRLFWLDGRAQVDGGPTALYTTTAGSVIETAELLDDRVCDCCQTDAAVTGMGPLVTYRDRSADERRDIAVAGLGTGVTSVHEDGWQIAGCPVTWRPLSKRTFASALFKARASSSVKPKTPTLEKGIMLSAVRNCAQ